MAHKNRIDRKVCIPKNSIFSIKMSSDFNKGIIVPFEELWKETIAIPLIDANKSDYDIIQFSFVILNKEKTPLLIERKRHNITHGFSILQSCSPCTHPKEWTYPPSLDDIRFYFEQEIRHEPYEYDIDLLGIARNIRKGINYFFYIFHVDFNVEKPKIFIKTEKDYLKGFCNLNSSHLLKGNKVDLLVMKILFPELLISQNETERCVLYEDKDHNLRDILFTTKESKEDKILQILGKLKKDTDTEETLFNKTILLQPNIMGMGINLNEIIKAFLKKDKKR